MNEKMSVKDLLLQLLKYEDEEHRRENTIYVTQVTQCLRRSFYEHMYGIDVQQKLKKPLLIGSAIHKYIEYLVNKHKDKLGMYIEAEKHIELQYHGYNIVGRADLVLDDTVIEFKVVSKTYKIPSILHLCQVAFYGFILRKSKICIVYIRDDGIHEFVYDEYMRFVDMFFNRLNSLIVALERGIIPPREEDFWCVQCPYKNMCLYRTLESYNGR